MCREAGQAAVEWIALIFASVALMSAVLAAVGRVDGRSMGGLVAERISCAAAGRCGENGDVLDAAYGERDAALVRRLLPGLMYEPGEAQVPVDWRKCRDVACATTSDDRDMDVHATDSGEAVTVFTRLIRTRERRFIQYWFYYPDSNSTFAGSDRIWRHSPLLRLGGLVLRGSSEYPGYHPDDWEAAAVSVDDRGEVKSRVTSHGHWQSCKWAACKDEWGRPSGWMRVSRGSHAGHLPVDRDLTPRIPGVDVRERTTTPDGMRVVPLETLDRRRYRRLDPGIAPPWEKDAFRRPDSPKS
jgi:hypothetical protein